MFCAYPNTSLHVMIPTFWASLDPRVCLRPSASPSQDTVSFTSRRFASSSTRCVHSLSTLWVYPTDSLRHLDVPRLRPFKPGAMHASVRALRVLLATRCSHRRLTDIVSRRSASSGLSIPSRHFASSPRSTSIPSRRSAFIFDAWRPSRHGVSIPSRCSASAQCATSIHPGPSASISSRCSASARRAILSRRSAPIPSTLSVHLIPLLRVSSTRYPIPALGAHPIDAQRPSHPGAPCQLDAPSYPGARRSSHRRSASCSTLGVHPIPALCVHPIDAWHPSHRRPASFLRPGILLGARHPS
jgi:hypothetical protein